MAFLLKLEPMMALASAIVIFGVGTAEYVDALGIYKESLTKNANLPKPKYKEFITWQAKMVYYTARDNRDIPWAPKTSDKIIEKLEKTIREDPSLKYNKLVA